jgi:hypothetical protein
MSVLSEFKQNLIVGREVDYVNHIYPALTQKRAISEVQTKKFAMRLDRPDGQIVDSWMDIPKSGDLIHYKRGDSDVFVIYREEEWDDNGPFCTMRFI